MPKYEVKAICNICGKEYNDFYEAIECEKKCSIIKSSDCKYEIEQKIGIFPPNDYFWLENGNDERQEYWAEQRQNYGFDERQVWSFNYNIITYLYPRFVMFKNIICSKPCDKSSEEWNGILDTIIMGFENYLKEDENEYNKEHDKNKHNGVIKSLELIKDNFFDLWY